ncbi:hypothetical protein BDV37DRAFT_263637 [Aspergillus pseudonomiae]|uniref:Uncharacterized protein n=1 Tax=Aspergillus pseudonomiae TaxID=1506151 RepID=A0A5N7CVV0_9EURO|nr:uncharacterized protein BDV37DRAFT_263637 [Aspergillus pseudonomiae]KAE8398302.1 hypothetical protein BDV37DRAFT_263637 [Aspergillus pseudonomiae]
MWKGIRLFFLVPLFLFFKKIPGLYLVPFRNDDAGEKHSACSGGGDGCAISTTFQLNGPSK